MTELAVRPKYTGTSAITKSSTRWGALRAAVLEAEGWEEAR